MATPKNPLGLVDVIDFRYAPWFSDADVREHRGRKGIGVVASKEEGNGYASDEGEPTMARFLSPGRINQAFDACVADRRLCCAEQMLAGEYADGCAEDADQILQEAVYRKVVWA